MIFRLGVVGAVMDRNRDLGQQRTVDLDRGLFLVQYKSADDEASPPKVVVSPASGHERSLELLLHPDADQGILWQPGSSLIVRVARAAQLQIAVVPQRQNGSRAASVEVKSVSQGTPPQAPQDEWDQEREPGSFRLLAHVAGIGDVVVGPNEWIAGPTAPSRIEGISIEWPNRPRDVELRYAAKSPIQAGTPAMVNLAAFAGTRGRAQPITGLVLEMSGRRASNWQFVAEALFLSSPTLRAVGQRVVLSGPTSREPLVGLRITIESTEVKEVVESAPAAVVRKAPSSARVRVFRSRPKQDASID